MKRRSFIAGAAGIAGAGGLAFGTGAFSSVEANRAVEVETAGDADAYLQIDFGFDVSDISGEFTESTADGLIGVDVNSITSDNGFGDGDGPNVGALSTFDELFTVTNAGSEGDEVFFWAEFPEDEDENLLEDIYFYPQSDDETRLEEGENALELETGDSVDIGIAIEKESNGDTEAYDPDGRISIFANTDLPSGTDPA